MLRTTTVEAEHAESLTLAFLGCYTSRMTIKRVQVEQYSLSEKDSALIEAGQRQEFQARPQIVYRPDELTVVCDRPEDLILRSLRIADREHVFDTRLDKSGRVVLAAMTERVLVVSERLWAVIENVGREPVAHVAPVFFGSSAETSDHTPLLAKAVGVGTKTRRFAIEPASQIEAKYKAKETKTYDDPAAFGCCVVHWSALWGGRVAKLQLVTDAQWDLHLANVQVGNKSQFIDANALPVELFREMRAISMEPMPVEQWASFWFRNDSETTRHVEIQLEYEADDVPASEMSAGAPTQ